MKKTKFYNSPITGFILSLLVNILFIIVLINLGDYLSVSRKGFVIVVSLITFFALVVNALFIWGFAYRKSFMRKIFVMISVLLIFGFGFLGYYTSRLSRGLDAIIDRDGEELLDYSFVTLDEGRSLNNLFSQNTIGYVDGDDEFNSSIQKEISNNSPSVEVVKFDRYEDMLHDLIEAESLDVAILPKQFKSYVEGMSEYAQEKINDAYVIHNFNISISSKEKTTTKVLDEPFSILMMGINENLADSIILTTINPKTLNVTMTSIARDSFLPISCYSGHSYDKINHARGRSRQCIIDTIETTFDVNIDFYFETDFYALVKIVDVLGGLELESPISFGGSLPKEDNPDEFHEIYIKKGKYLMNGYEVITFARERANFGSGDFQRQLNQQYVIKELANKIFEESKRNVETPLKVLEAAEDNIVMNLSLNKDISPLLGFAINNIAASPVSAMDTFNIHSSQVQGESTSINGIYYMIPYRNSIEDVKEIIRRNMSTEIEDPKEEPFSFSINYPYNHGIDTDIYKYLGTELITDSSYHEAPSVTYQVPDFTTSNISEVRSWASRNGVSLEVRYIDETYEAYRDYYEDGQIIYQSIEPGTYEEMPLYLEISVITKPVNHDNGDESIEDGLDEMPDDSLELPEDPPSIDDPLEPEEPDDEAQNSNEG